VSLSVGGTLALGGVAARRGAVGRRKRGRRSARPTAAATPRSSIPRAGSFPGVLIWPDAFGLRPSMRAIGRRLAGEGYAVLVPNPYYRSARRRCTTPPPTSTSAIRRRCKSSGRCAPRSTRPGNAEKDAAAYVAFLDAQPQVDKARKIGTQGYCMGGALVVRSAAALPGRIGAGASFHGGGLVTDKPDSPHLLAPKIARGCTSASR
jgi:carboxymethylenebutenolidase